MPFWQRPAREAVAPDTVEAMLEEVEALLDDDEPGRALRLADDAVRAARRLDAEDSGHLSIAQTLRAQALIDMGRFDHARRAAEEALAESADYAPAHFERGIALYRLGRFDEAADAVATACELDA